MSQKKWTREGKKLREQNPALFNVKTGFIPRAKGGPHSRDTDYKRSDRREDERRAKRGMED